MQEDWVLSIREQCKAAGVAFFFKQWGSVRKKVAGRTLRGSAHMCSQVPTDLTAGERKREAEKAARTDQ
jgi:protein gp37